MADGLNTDEKKMGDGGTPKVEFSPEQQAQIQTLIDSSYKKAYAKAEEKYKAEAEALKVAMAEKTKEGKGGEDNTALKERLAVLEADKAKNREYKREADLLAAASELNAVHSKQVATLVSHSVKINEDGSLAVINADGVARNNDKGQPMSVKELVSEFLATNPHFVKAGGQMGAGSHGAQGFVTQTVDLSKLPAMERLKIANRAVAKN